MPTFYKPYKRTGKSIRDTKGNTQLPLDRERPREFICSHCKKTYTGVETLNQYVKVFGIVQCRTCYSKGW